MEEEEAQVPAKGWKRCGSKDLAGDRQNRRMPETLETPHPLQLRLPTSSTSWLPDPSKRTSPPSSPPPPLSPHRTATSTTTTATPTTTPNVPTPASTSQKDILKTSQERSKEAGSQIGREKGEKGDQEFVKEAPQRAVKTLFKQQPSPPQQHKEIPEPEKEHGEKVDVDHQRVLEERRGSLIPFKKRLPRIHRLCKDPESIKELQILVKKLKKRKSHKLEVRDKYGLSPLHAAIEGNNFAAVRILLKAKVNINACDRNDWTALHMACHNGELDIVEILLTDPTADRDVRSLDHSTPLHYIVRHDPPPGQEERYSLILQQLLGKEGRVYRKISNNTSAINKNKETPLHSAAASGSYIAVQWLLNHHAEVNKCNLNNETALHFAIRAHAAKVVELLMEKGASDKIVGAFGSPLEMAAGNEAILAILQPEQHQK